MTDSHIDITTNLTCSAADSAGCRIPQQFFIGMRPIRSQSGFLF
jgi:hypothetical protein